MSDEEKDKSAPGPQGTEPKPEPPASTSAGEKTPPAEEKLAAEGSAQAAPAGPKPAELDLGAGNTAAPSSVAAPRPPAAAAAPGDAPAGPKDESAAPAAAPGEPPAAPPATPKPRPAAPAAAAGEGGAPAAPRPAPAPRAPAGPSPVELAQRAEVPSAPLDRLKARFPDIAKGASFFVGIPIVPVPVGSIIEVCRFLKEDPDARCTYLSNLHGTHNPDKKDAPFEVVYHLYSIHHAQWIELKVEAADGQEVPSVTGVWKTANWHEREAFDMLGIRFAGHPDLTRILLSDDWKGHPLRKEYPLEGNPGDHGYWRTASDR